MENKTVQYYKFLFYSMKTEIKLYELFTLISWTNLIEILTWAISMILFVKFDVKSPFAIINLTHLLRGIMGHYVLAAMPKSHQMVERLSITEEDMENKDFKDLMKKEFQLQIMNRITNMNSLIITYFALTFVNFFVDLIDFLISITRLNDEDMFHYQGYSRLMISLVFISIFFLIKKKWSIWVICCGLIP